MYFTITSHLCSFMTTVAISLLLIHTPISFWIMQINFFPGILSARKLIVFLKCVLMLQDFVGNVHMAMIFSALSMLDKFKSFFFKT